MTNFYTSDLHFFHSNIIKYCNRPFSSAEEMNKQLIQNWNSVIGKDDTVYNLGDFSFNKSIDDNQEIFNSLNGNKILIKGNHDGKSVVNLPWREIHDICYISDYGKMIVMCHFPFKSWHQSHRGSYHLYGHCHGTLPRDSSLSLDVGVDGHNYFPIKFEQIQNILEPNKD